MPIAAGNQVLASEMLTEHNADWTHKAAALVSAGITTYMPSGAILAYGGAAAPTGWLLCYGQAVSRTTYANLFTAISTTFGAGDGSTTFNVPDLRGRLPLGADNMGGASANRVTATEADNLGQGSGAETHTLVTAEMPAHTHSMSGTGSGSQGSAEAADANVIMNPTSSTGAGGAHNNVQPYQTVNYIIKT